ncbi:MAG: putative cysteine desulfurase 2 [archaeon ADurb.Bin336]|jgi:cysteine desulfurase/selenocysteine lyase|nr:MAG: putative cysteine desulfurase 2 [archaeon ADurb.Bin336]
MNVEKIREDFPLLKREIRGKKIVYLDNAATTLKPQQVIDAVVNYYENASANVHRGLHVLSEEASREHENAHETVANFVGAKKEETVFVRNATEGLNLVMYSLLNSNYFKKGDKIIVSKMEHHSNIVPWQYLEKKIGVKLEYVGLNEDYTLDMNDFESKVRGAKLVSMTAASNTIATLPNIREITKKAHNEGALMCVDGAQLVPHEEINFSQMNIDFLAFSGHKMLAPTGTGALIGKKKLLEEFEPFMFGGDMIHSVDYHSSSWNTLPNKFEAGTPHIAGSYGIKKACEYLKKIGMNNIKRHEENLTKIALEEIQKIDSVRVYGPLDHKKQGGIILFDSPLIATHELAMALSEAENICIRSGMHCAEPIVSSINKEGLARASFYLYNTEEEILFFIKALKETLSVFG